MKVDAALVKLFLRRLEMFLEDKKIELKDGRVCTLRSPRPDDALRAIEYMKVTAGETDFLARYPEVII